MGKMIKVTKQQREKIVHFYVDEKMGVEAVKRAIGVKWDAKVIKRILKEEGIKLRPTYGGRKKIQVPRETQLRIIEAYNKGWGLDKIVRELNLDFSFDKVKSVLKDNNVHIRNVQEAHEVMTVKDLRKFPVNDDYNLLSHNGAWLMGFIAADGYLPITKGARNRIVITLAEKDEDILHLIAKELEFNGNIAKYDVHLGEKTYKEVSLAFASKKIRQQLESYGIVNNKTFKLHHLPNIPKEYMLDFIAGYFDGDGSLGRCIDGSLFWNITSANKDFLEEIMLFLHNEYGLSFKKIYTDKNAYSLRYWKKEEVLKAGALLYENDYLRLPRKRKKYYSIRKQLPRDSISQDIIR